MMKLLMGVHIMESESESEPQLTELILPKNCFGSSFEGLWLD
jgi:hypothetical protein